MDTNLIIEAISNGVAVITRDIGNDVISCQQSLCWMLGLWFGVWLLFKVVPGARI